MATARPFRPGLHYLARLLIFAGITTLIIGAPDAAQTSNYQALWQPVIGLAIFLCVLSIRSRPFQAYKNPAIVAGFPATMAIRVIS